MTGGGSCGQEGERETHTLHMQCHMCSRCVVSVCGECAVGMSAVVGVRWMRKKVGKRRMCGRVLGWLTGNDLAVTKEYTQLYCKLLGCRGGTNAKFGFKHCSTRLANIQYTKRVVNSAMM